MRYRYDHSLTVPFFIAFPAAVYFGFPSSLSLDDQGRFAWETMKFMAIFLGVFIFFTFLMTRGNSSGDKRSDGDFRKNHPE